MCLSNHHVSLLGKYSIMLFVSILTFSLKLINSVIIIDFMMKLYTSRHPYILVYAFIHDP